MDTALKFLSPGPRNDVTDHLEVGYRSFIDNNAACIMPHVAPRAIPCATRSPHSDPGSTRPNQLAVTKIPLKLNYCN